MPVLPFNLWRTLAGLALVVAWQASATSTNSDWFARVWESDDGLPNNNINGLAQTSDGYLWVATPVGLARFDGNRFEEISPTNFVAAPNRGVVALTASHGGGLWLEMDRGAVVGLEAGNVRVFSTSDGLPDLLANQLVEESDGTVWIAYIDGTLCSIKDRKVVVWGDAEGLPSGRVSSVARDFKGRIWLQRGGQLGIVENGRFRLLAYVFKMAQIAAARAGGVWLCNGQKLERCDEAGVLKDFGVFQSGLVGVGPQPLLEDDQGAVWIGSSFAGLFRFDGTKFERVATSHPEILSLTEDGEGNIWVGTHGGGLNRLRPRALRAEGEGTGLPFEAVQSVTEDTNGVLWAATGNGQLVRRAGDRWSALSTNDGWNGIPICCVAADRAGGVWIGGRSHRLVYWRNGVIDGWGKSRGMDASPILTLLPATNGDLWITGQNHVVQCFHAGVFRSLKLPEDTRNFRASAGDATGNIWFGTSKGLILRAEGEEVVDETARIGAPLEPIRCLYATPDGSLWIGYAGRGVGRLKDGHFSLIGTAQGLFDNYISQIVADARDWLWLGSDHGIFKVRCGELNAVADGRASRVRSVHYGAGEGVPSLQADYGFAPGAARSRDGRLWIPTRNALAAVDPNQLRENPAAPPVLLKRVALDEKTIAVREEIIPSGAVTNLETLRAPLRLPPGHRKLEFEFTALSFTAVGNVRFQHRLEGFDGGWIEGSDRAASYPQLPAGNYRFRVKACNSDGVWNDTGTTLAFVVTPFMWQTWWFRTGALALFSLLVILVVRYVSFRHLRMKLRALEQQAALDRERARIARDLHDDLGSRLTRIVLLSDLITDNGSEPEKSIGNAQAISSTARQVIKALDETVWAVNPRNDQLPHLISYVGQFALEFLRTAGIRGEVDLPERVPERPVTAEVRHNLFLVVKEALNNVVRHASATEVTLRVTVDDEAIALTIEDNGQGFAEATDETGADGLRNMRQRMEDIGGHFRVESRPGAGTKIAFECRCPAGKDERRTSN